jgi:hypothetical protein
MTCWSFSNTPSRRFVCPGECYLPKGVSDESIFVLRKIDAAPQVAAAHFDFAATALFERELQIGEMLLPSPSRAVSEQEGRQPKTFWQWLHGLREH